MKDELKALRVMYKETTDPVVQLHIIAFGKSINKLMEENEILMFDTLSDKSVMKKVLDDIDYDKMNKWLNDKGYF